MINICHMLRSKIACHGKIRKIVRLFSGKVIIPNKFVWPVYSQIWSKFYRADFRSVEKIP